MKFSSFACFASFAMFGWPFSVLFQDDLLQQLCHLCNSVLFGLSISDCCICSRMPRRTCSVLSWHNCSIYSILYCLVCQPLILCSIAQFSVCGLFQDDPPHLFNLFIFVLIASLISDFVSGWPTTHTSLIHGSVRAQ